MTNTPIHLLETNNYFLIHSCQRNTPLSYWVSEICNLRSWALVRGV